MYIPNFSIKDKIPGASNFRYAEFLKSMTATRLGIVNAPPGEEEWKNIELLASNVLQPVRNEFGPIRILSGFRSKELNRVVGGSDNSLHCYGFAADIEPLKENVKLMSVLEFIYENLEFKELIAEYFDRNGWVHVAYVNGSNDKKLKLKDEVHNYRIVSVDYLKELYKNWR